MSMARMQSNKQQGHTLIEILISLLILSFGLLGFANMEVIALRGTQDAYWLSLADEALSSTAEELLLTKMQAGKTRQFWQNYLESPLPKGNINITGKSPNRTTITYWQPHADSPTHCQNESYSLSNCLSIFIKAYTPYQ